MSGFLPLTWPFLPQRVLTNLPQQLAKPEVTQLGPQNDPFSLYCFQVLPKVTLQGKQSNRAKEAASVEGPQQVFLWILAISRCLKYVPKHLEKWCLRTETSVVAKVHWNPWVWTSPCMPPVLCYMGFSGSKLGWIQIDVSYTIFRVLFDFNYFLTVLLFEKIFLNWGCWLSLGLLGPFPLKYPFNNHHKSLQGKQNLLEDLFFCGCVKICLSQLSFLLPDFRLVVLSTSLEGGNPRWAPAGCGATLGSSQALLVA